MRPVGRLLEPGEHAQQRGLAAARGAEQREELAAPDVSETSSAPRTSRKTSRHAAQAMIGIGRAIMPPSRARCRSALDARRSSSGTMHEQTSEPTRIASPAPGRRAAGRESAAGSRCRAAGWSRAAEEEGEDELVERDGEADQEAGDDAGHDQRQGDPPEGHPAGLAEVERGLLQAAVEAQEAARRTEMANGRQNRTWPA